MEDNKLLFGIFHTAYEKSKEQFYKIIDSKLVNTIIIEDQYGSPNFEKSMDYIIKHNIDISIWLSVAYLGFKIVNNNTVADTGNSSSFNPTSYFLPDYKKRIDDLVKYLKDKNYYDHITGFYMDEPLLWNIKNEWLHDFTKYIRKEATENKRFFICFSVAGIAPEIWTINDVKPINEYSTKYLTDIAFDMYHKWSDDYNRLVKYMCDRSGNRDDLKIWMIPCVMNYRGDYKEEYAIEHLNNCYDIIKNIKNPGGLMCYTYYTFPSDVEDLGNIGLDKLSDKDSKYYWPNLIKRVKEISKEITGD